MNNKLIVNNPDGHPIYPIFLEESFAGVPAVLHSIQADGRKICIVTDSNVAPLYAGEVKGLLKGRLFLRIIFISGRRGF